MRGDRPSREQERQRRRIDFLTSDEAPVEERGWSVLFLLAHACAYLLLIAAQATWAVVTGVRVWRRRETGLAASVRSGVHKPTLAVLLAARLAYLIFRRAGLAKLNRRADVYAAQHRPSA
jgi:hypothetical protein